MKLNNQRRMVSEMKGVGLDRVKFDSSRLADIKEAITKADLRALINDHAIKIEPKRGVSRVRARKILKQKSKGKRQGKGSRKGKKKSRLTKKRAWINKVRIQREFIKGLRDEKTITTQTHKKIYKKISGGFFRSRSHVKLYLQEQKLFEKNGKK